MPAARRVNAIRYRWARRVMKLLSSTMVSAVKRAIKRIKSGMLRMKTLCVALMLAALPATGEPVKYRGQKATLLIPDGIPFSRETFLAFPVLTATFESDGEGGVRFTGVDSASRIPRLRQC